MIIGKENLPRFNELAGEWIEARAGTCYKASGQKNAERKTEYLSPFLSR